MLFIAVITSVVVVSVYSADVHIIVQPTGSDHNNGLSTTHPVKTIEKAISRLNDPDVKGNNVFIELRKGTYDLSKTVSLKSDLGHSVTIRSFYNGEPVTVTGGRHLASEHFHPVTDSHILAQIPSSAHSKIRQMKLSDAGITLSQLGHLERFGFGHSRTAPMEISYNGKALRLARWPNDGSYVNVESTPDGREGKRFTYPSSFGSRAEKWRHENDLWVYGFWYWSWADDSAKIASVDPAHHTMTLGSELHYGMRTGHIQSGNHAGYSQQGGYFHVFNALSELDQGGEYYIDRKSGILYIYPPTQHGDLSHHDVVYASLLNSLFELSHLSHFHISDLILDGSRHYGILGQSLSSCSFDRLEIRNTGSYGMHLSGSNILVRQCDIHDTDGGISISGLTIHCMYDLFVIALSSTVRSHRVNHNPSELVWTKGCGDRRTLTPSGCVLENNRIWDFSRAAAVGSHGIALGGVGTHVQYNEVTGGRYTGVWWGGNDHVIRRNHLHHLCTGSSDCGGIHADRDWTFRGNVIQQNHIHHVLRFYPGAQVRGVMLDDQYSSVLIEGNVFHDNEIHFNIGGGRDNIARYNVFYNAHSASVGMDGRGINGGSNDKQLHDRLKTVPYTTGIWAQKYPELARIDHEAPGEPRGNQIYKNVLYHGLASHNFNYHGSSLQKSEFFNIHDNFVDTHTSDFNDRGTGDYRVICKAGTWAGQQHFPQPPTEAEVGPHLPYGPKFKHGTVHTKSNGALKHC